jgi:hypothetical protein
MKPTLNTTSDSFTNLKHLIYMHFINLHSFVSGFPDMEVEFLANAKPCMEIKRDGDHLIIDYEIMPGMVNRVRFKLGEEFVSKDMKNDPPTFDAQVLVELVTVNIELKTTSE